MSNNWEDTFRSWGGSPSKTEQEKCDNAERAIKKAVDASDALTNRDIIVFPKGSYRNRTNVRADSDVDICVLCKDSIITDFPKGMTRESFNLSPASYHYSNYRNDVGKALTDYFGSGGVERGNKSFDVHENTYRVDADVVACFGHRRYREDGTYLEGEAFFPDTGSSRIANWSNQNYENGVKKNTATGRRFKAVVRILKHLRNEMVDNGHETAKSIPSFLIECLIWNVPNEGFGHDTYTDDVRWVLANLWNNTRNDSDCEDWVEINERKYLFRSSQPWTHGQVNTFLNEAWNYIGFE